MSNKPTLQATVDRLNRYQWTQSIDKYLKCFTSWEMETKESPPLQTVVRVLVYMHYNREEDNWFFKVSLDSPCVLFGLSVTEAERMLELTKKALNLATRAQYIVEGLSWSKEEVNDFLATRSPSEE